MKKFKVQKFIGNCIIVCSLIGLGFTLGVSTQSTTAAPKVNSVEEMMNTQRVSYDEIYIHGVRYIVFSNSSGSDIEIVRN